MNGAEEASFGYISSSTTTVASASYQRISLRVKASEGAKAYLYLMETKAENAGKSLSVPLPACTYWYDDDGNICAVDPSDEDFDETSDILYRLQPNGLYKREGDVGETYYANTSAYQFDSEGNLTTKDDEIVFYFNNGNFYAYRDEDANGNYTYNTPIQPLPAEIARYNYSHRDAQQAQIVVEGTGDWVNVSFFVHTGDVEKTFRVEVWSGDRNGEDKNPANSYVIFDNYNSANASSNYTNLLNASIQSVRDELNEGKSIEDEDYLGANDRLPEDYEYATYYTYSFFDSSKYVRYDETTDFEEKGNPWHNYKQSTYSEQLVSLYQVDKEDGKATGYNFFADFGATDITITAEYPNDPDADEEETDTTDPTGTANIWLLISSGVLAVVLLLVIILVMFRNFFNKKRRTARVKNSKPGKKPKKASQSV